MNPRTKEKVMRHALLVMVALLFWGCEGVNPMAPEPEVEALSSVVATTHGKWGKRDCHRTDWKRICKPTKPKPPEPDPDPVPGTGPVFAF